MTALRIATTGTSATTTVSIAKPTGITTGDVCLIFINVVNVSGTATVGTITGFTASTAQANTGNASFICRGYARVIDNTETWPLTCTVTAPAGSIAEYFTATYSGASGFDPTTLPTPHYVNTGTAVVSNAMTLANTGDWIAWFGGYSRNGSTTSQATTIPTGFASQSAPGNVAGTTASTNCVFCDLESAQASGSFTAPNGTGAGTFANCCWSVGISPQTAVGATLTVPNLALAAPILAPAATAQAIPLTAPVLTLAAPSLAPNSSAVALALTTPHLAMAAPLLTVQSASTVALSKPNLALAAPLLTPQATAQAIPLTTPQLTLSAPLLTVQNSVAVPLTTAQLTFQAFPLNPNTVNPVYINPWYANQLDALDSDFEGPNVP